MRQGAASHPFFYSNHSDTTGGGAGGVSEKMPETADDAGIGMIEIVVAMFMLALLALSFAPLLAGTLRLSASSADRTTAAELVERQLAEARAQTATCAGLTTYAASPAPAAATGRGVVLNSTRTVACPATYPGTARVTVAVRAAGDLLASATTLVFVSSA
jgi:Tfp pilus assembly protein PilV